jgi:hypothetical protein
MQRVRARGAKAGTRRPKADVDALVDAIVAFSHMAAQLGDRLVEAEINPVFVLPQGQGVRAADGVVILR